MCVVLVLAACGPQVAAPSPSASITGAVAPTPTHASSFAAPSPLPSTAGGGIEVFATGDLRGTYAWVVNVELAAQDRVTETLYAVPMDGSAPKMALRRLRDKTDMAIVPFRQLSPDGTKLALEPAPLGPVAHDGLVVVDLAAGTMRELARGDQRFDAMPAWSPDGARIAYVRRNSGATPLTRDDGIWVINADGTGNRQVRLGGTHAEATAIFGWTADGAGIAFALAFEGLPYAIADARTGDVTGPAGIVFGLTPASWRTKVPQFAGAFSAGDKGGEQRIDVADGIGKLPRTIWHEPPTDATIQEPLLLNPRWSPVGDEILYMRSAREGKLLRISASGGVPREVPIQGQPFKAEWLPDGRIAYITVANGVGAVLHVIDGTSATTLFKVDGGASFTDFGVRTYP